MGSAQCYHLFLYYSSTNIFTSKLLLRVNPFHTGPGYLKDGKLEPGVYTVLATILLSFFT